MMKTNQTAKFLILAVLVICIALASDQKASSAPRNPTGPGIADLFASINGTMQNGGGEIFEFTPAGAQSSFASGLNRPRGVAFDSAGNLFVATNFLNGSVFQGTILKIDPTGAQTTFANVVGPSASFFLEDIKIDNAGNIFVSASIDSLLDPNAPATIYKFTPNGTQSTFGFVPGQNFGIAFDSEGNLYAGDGVFQKIYKFLPDGRSSVFVDTSAFGTDEGPTGLTIDQFDNLFATVVTVDSMNNVGPGRILKVAPDGTQNTFATGLNNNPRGSAFDSSGNLFVAEVPPTTTGDILKIDPNGMVTVFASGLGRPQGNGGAEFVAFQPFPVIKGNPSASATNGSQFIYQIAATNHPASYAASGLPAGLGVDPGSGIISGVPTITGNFQVSISASNLFGTGSNNLDLTVQPAPAGPEIISSTTATGRTGELFRFQVLTSGTTSSALLTTSALPTGLSANSTTGLILGTPTANGTFNITLTITDGGNTATGMLQLTFTSDPEIPIITSGDTASLVPGQFFSYTLTADANGNFSYIGTDGQVHTGSGSAGLPPGLMYDAPSHTISGVFMPSGKMNRTYRRSARPIRHTFSIGQPDTLKIRPPGIGTCQPIVSNESGTGTNPLNFFEGYFVTVRAAPSNRAGSVSGGYNPDVSVTVVATPAPSHGFLNWTNEDGSIASTSASYTFTPTSDRTIRANFIVTGPTPTPPPSSTPKPNPPPGPSATPRPSSTPK